MAVWSIVKVSELEGANRLDAEYYQPKYTDAVSAVTAYRNAKRLTEVASILRGRNPHVYTEEGIPIIRAIDLRDITDLSNVLYASPNEPLFYLREGDILVSSIGAGSIGKVEMFSACNGKAATVSEVSVVRITKGDIKPSTLAVFLRSRYGFLQLERRITGSTGQLHLYPKDIGTVIVPIFELDSQEQISNAFDKSMALLKQSKSLYLQAKRMVLEEIGWDKLDLSQPKWWTVSLSRAREVHRLDAEHFQPKYDKLIAHLKKTGRAKALGEIATYIKRGLQPEYVEDGEIIVVNSQHLGRYLLNVEATQRTDRKFWDDNKRSRLQKKDVLLYSTGAYVGRTNTWLEDQEGIASNHVTIIRPIAPCNPLYLAVFLNAPVGLLQTEKWASGSGQREIYPDDIGQFLIHLPPEKFQQQVADLVQQSYQARQKAKALLEEAKAKVEALIEERGD